MLQVIMDNWQFLTTLLGLGFTTYQIMKSNKMYFQDRKGRLKFSLEHSESNDPSRSMELSLRIKNIGNNNLEIIDLIVQVENYHSFKTPYAHKEWIEGQIWLDLLRKEYPDSRTTFLDKSWFERITFQPDDSTSVFIEIRKTTDLKITCTYKTMGKTITETNIIRS